MERLSNVDRHRALGMVEGGLSYRHSQSVWVVCTLRLLDWLKGTTLWGLWTINNALDVIVLLHVSRYIVMCHLRDRFRTSVETAQETEGTHNLRVSALTVRRHLQEHGISSLKTYKGNVLTAKCRISRFNWCRQRFDWHNSVGVLYCSRTSPVFVLKCLIGGVKYGVDVGGISKLLC